MDSNIKSEQKMFEIKLVVDEKIVGWAHSYSLKEINDWEIIHSIHQEIPVERKLRDRYIFGEFSSITFYKFHCKPFPRFFDIQLYEDNKLIESIKDLYLQDIIYLSPEELKNYQFGSSSTLSMTNELIIFENRVKFSNKDSKELKKFWSDVDNKHYNQVFTDEFKKKLDLGKYTSWVNKLSPEQLQGLFWIIGEVKIRSGRVFDELKIDEICYGLDEDKIQGSAKRMKCGLSLLLRFLSGQNKTLDEVQKEIIESVK